MMTESAYHPTLQQIPPELASVDDYERLARNFLLPAHYEYIAGGVADDYALRNNRQRFARLQLHSRVLGDCRHGGTATQLLGQMLAHPILLAPVAHQKLAHPQGELATAAGAAAMDALMVVSTLSSSYLEDIAQQSAAPKWFQVYCQPTRQLTLALVRRAEAAGYTALMVTVDAPVTGARNRSQRAGFQLPTYAQAVNLPSDDLPPLSLNPQDSLVFQGVMATAPRWEDLSWLQRQTNLPIIVKGILHPEDALRCMELGMAGIVVSNHGGRSHDSAPASIDMLPVIRQRVGAAYPILLDSGIRRGSDVFKALALGADAVMVGRPQVFALAVAGALGVAHMLRLLREELELTMALTGCPTLDCINSDALYRANLPDNDDANYA